MLGNWLRFFCALTLAFGAPAAFAQNAPPGAGENLTLDAVVVTASRTAEKLREVTSNVTVINEEAIKKSSATDLGQLLRQEGFDVSGSNGGGKQLRVRGMESPQMEASDLTSRVLILLNGRRMGGPNVDWIGLTNVERVEIIRGPAAVQYGPAAMGGVVNVITKRGGEKTAIRAEAGMGSNDLARFKLAASGQSETGLIDFSFGAGQQYQGEYKTGDGWVWQGTRTGNRYGFNGDLGVNFAEGQRIGFNYNYFGLFGDESPPYNPVSHSHPANPGYDTDLYGNPTTHDATNSNVAIVYDGSSEAFNWQGQVALGRYEDKGSYGTTVMNLKNLTAALGYDEGGLFALSGGLDYMIYDVDADSGARPEYKDLGVYLSGKLRFLEDSLIFSAGGRFDSFKLDQPGAGVQDKSETNFSPSLGLAWLPLDWLKLRANYSQGFKMPHPMAVWGNSWYLPNPDLKPEKSQTWEVGLDASYEFFNASLTYFHSKLDDKLLAMSKGGWVYQFTNLQGATIAGFELALSADLGQALQQDFTLRPYVNLTYLPTRRNEDHSGSSSSVEVLGFDTLTNTSQMTMSYGLDFVAPAIDLTANLNASYAGEKISRDYSAPGNPWTEYAPGTIVDLTIEKGLWEFQDMGKLKVRAELNNLLDKYDEAYINYPGPGRTFYVGLAYEY